MRRREFIGIVGGAAAWPLVAHAQRASKVWRIGYLGFGTAAAFADRAEALRAGLRDFGYIEGKNIVIEFRWAETVEQLQEAAAEVVRMNVDVIFATSSAETEHAKQATNTIPIVFATHADPVGLGHVASLAARRQHHGIVGAANGDHRQADGDIERDRAAGDADRRALEPHRPVIPPLPASRRGLLVGNSVFSF